MNGNTKKTMFKFGKKCFYLGQDADGINYWMDAATWDCSRYWGGGYIETYTNNRNPERAKDIASHQHFDSMFFRGKENAHDLFVKKFVNNPYTDSEIWKICELMKAFYTARYYSDMIHRGGTHYTTNPAAGAIKSEEEYRRINEKVIPAIVNELYKIMEA